MKLDEVQRHSALWQLIDKEITERLETLRRKNDGFLDTQETDRLRGSIAALKEIQAWAIVDPKFDQ